MRIIFRNPIYTGPTPPDHEIKRLLEIHSDGINLQGRFTPSAGGGAIQLGRFVGGYIQVDVSLDGRPQLVVYKDFSVLRDK